MVSPPQYKTLAPGVVTTVTLPESEDHIEVVNVNGAGAVYFRLDGTDPDIDTDGSYFVNGSVGAFLEVYYGDEGRPTNTVKLKSSAAVKVTVRGW